MIYLDHAATTPLDKSVLEAMLPYMRESFGNPSSQHASGRASANAVVSARDKIAAVLGCKADELFFTSGGTECGNWALKGACAAACGYGARRGHIAVSAIEHPAVLESARDMQRFGYEVTFIKPDADGAITPQAVEDALRDNTVFCAVMHANNETGVIQPVEEIGKILKERGVFYYCDCVQTAGFMPLPVKSCTALGISAHKLYGPVGFGALYIENGAKICRLISGGKQERGLRGGTTNAAAAVGLATALQLCAARADGDNKKIAALRDGFEERVLSGIFGAHINGGGKRLPSHSNISFDGCDGENLLFLLDMQGIAVSTGSACSAGAVTPSHVLLAMGTGEARAKSAVRFTFGRNNTEEELEKTVAALKLAVQKIRKSR